jgi:hypothetical protein
LFRILAATSGGIPGSVSVDWDYLQNRIANKDPKGTDGFSLAFQKPKRNWIS